MKTTIIAVTALLAGHLATAQTDYYTGKDTVQGRNVTYLVNDWVSQFSVKNIANKIENEAVKLNGERLDVSYMAIRIKAESRAAIYRAFEETFTPEEIEDCRSTNEKFWAHMLVSHDGDVIQVRFNFPKTPKMLAISPDKLFILENKLKQYVKAPMSPELKKQVRYGMTVDALIFREIGMVPLPKQRW